ncbi:MAG: hypothetical protein K2X39_10455 [Silvanigrellaceae bacterium]|nr:hypothetical protein [Silvanigrellaceae bacterium]
MLQPKEKNLSVLAAQIKQMRENGLSYAYISSELKCSYETVRKIFKDGKKNRKIQDRTSLAEQMIELRNKGMTLETVGERYHYTRQRVSQIINEHLRKTGKK